ncbi:MAG TPA: hypothetical protein VGL89_13690 [Candidatus Koribacter sp.]
MRSTEGTLARALVPAAPYEFVEFCMLGINPKEGTNLVWKFVQYYADGTKEEFTGPVGSRLPSPVTVLKKPDVVAVK